MNIIQKKMMKRRLMMYIVFMMVSFILLTFIVVGKTNKLQYEIYFDTETVNTSEIKNEVLKRYSDLVKGVHEESEVVIVRNNLDMFIWEKDMKAEWNGNRLIIKIGDSNGVHITGDLEQFSFCLPKPQPKSLLQKIFS